MNRPNVYVKTIETLEYALLKKKIRKGYPESCATSMIVASANGVETFVARNGATRWKESFPYWATLFYPDIAEDVEDEDYEALGQEQIEKTGYTVDEIEKLDLAFESGDDLYSGLNNFLRVLHKIHEEHNPSHTINKNRKLLLGLV